MPLPLYREALDEMECQVPGCTHKNHPVMYFHARCHPAAKLEVTYDRISTQLRIRCGICRRDVALIAVADAPLPREGVPI